jgi:hypothetical protein
MNVHVYCPEHRAWGNGPTYNQILEQSPERSS